MIPKIRMQLDETEEIRLNMNRETGLMEGYAEEIRRTASRIGSYWRDDNGAAWQRSAETWVNGFHRFIGELELLHNRIRHEEDEWADVVLSFNYAPEDSLQDVLLEGISFSDWWLYSKDHAIDFSPREILQELFPDLPWELAYPPSTEGEYFKSFLGFWVKEEDVIGEFDNDASGGKSWIWQIPWWFLGGLGTISIFGPTAGTSAGAGGADTGVLPDNRLGGAAGGSIFSITVSRGWNTDLFGLLDSERFIGINLGFNCGKEYGLEWNDGIDIDFDILDLGVIWDDPKEFTPP